MQHLTVRELPGLIVGKIIDGSAQGREMCIHLDPDRCCHVLTLEVTTDSSGSAENACGQGILAGGRTRMRWSDIL
jgi:hypothetical protein